MANVDRQAKEMFSRLIKQLSGNEDVTEALKVKNQMLWRQKMNNPRNAAMEIISHMTVDYFKLIRYNEKL
ncbi:TnpV protein [Dysosmobacter sp.]|uniref:TnpV protein n=2 Tax=Dysosmobacter sp. TaxID=2591382 RepID=UPI003AEF8D1E